MAASCKRWNIKTNEENAQAIDFHNQTRLPDAFLKVNGRSIPFLNIVKYFGVIFDKKIT
jgi:hypothetical protein